MISTETMTDDLSEDRVTMEMGVQTCPEVTSSSVTSSEMCAPMGTSDSNRDRIFVHSTPRNIMKNHNYDSDSISCYSSGDSGADSSITLIKGSGEDRGEAITIVTEIVNDLENSRTRAARSLVRKDR